MAAEKRTDVEAAPPEDGVLFRELFENSATGAALFSIGGRFLRVNPALCRMLGYGEQELQNKNHLDVIHLDDLESAAMSRAQIISGKAKSRLAERRYVHKDGSTVWAQVAGAVVRDASGAPLCTALFANDVSGLKRAVRASEQRFRRMVEMSSDWYWVQDEQFHFVEVPGLDHQGEDTDIVLGKARWEIPGLNTSGELRYLSVSGEPLFDEQGRFRGYHGIGKDITDRARDQKALEDSEERYRMLFDVQPQPMWVVDAKTLAFLAVNGAAMRLYGYSKDEFLAMTADQIRPEEDVDDLRKAFEDRSRNYRQRVWRHRKKNGELIQVKVISFNLDFDGHAARLGVIHDMTEQLNAEERARETEERYLALLRERQSS
jgi:PAS domain S-box-containing protein